MHQHERVVVHVHDAAVRGDLLGDLVGVGGGGEARSQVQELPDAGLADQMGHRASEELAVGACRGDDVGDEGLDLVAQPPVGVVVVLAAQPVVPDPGGVRHGDVELRLLACLLGGGGVAGHDGPFVRGVRGCWEG